MKNKDQKVHYGYYNDKEWFDQAAKRIERQLNIYSADKMNDIFSKDKFSVTRNEDEYFHRHEERWEKERGNNGTK